jgi:hypothetical protein
MNSNVQSVTIQQTGKVFKGQQAASVILGLVSVGAIMLAENKSPGTMGLALSFVWYMTLKTLIWWYHR